MKKVIVIQARMSSNRLPGKSLREIAGKALIMHVIERARLAENFDEVVLATSSESSDDVLAEYLQRNSVRVFRGSLNNVQDRFFSAVKKFKADLIVRVTGDNPFVSSKLIDIMYAEWKREKVDYLGYSKCIYGIGAELFTFDAFKKAIRLSSSDYDFEHVTPPFYKNKNIFKTKALVAPAEFCNDSLSLTVDTEDDFKFIEKIFNYFKRHGIVNFSAKDINLWHKKINGEKL